MTIISGTKEWAENSVNCVTGCAHGCRYCYARERAVRYRQVDNPAAWTIERVRRHDVVKTRKLLPGRVMFPTTHDLTPGVALDAIAVLVNLLAAGNHVLVVSKPHRVVIEQLIFELSQRHPIGHRNQVVFRFTVGTLDPEVAAYWEPFAPTPDERLQCARIVRDAGYPVGFSMEPALEPPDRLIPAARTLLELATDVVWIGKLNSARARWLPAGTEQDEPMMARLEAGQTNAAVREVYDALAAEPRIRWKESYKKVLGLDLQQEAGEKQAPCQLTA